LTGFETFEIHYLATLTALLIDLMVSAASRASRASEPPRAIRRVAEELASDE
jgi:hypothetical protein